jgi:hypothetical protein
LNRYLLAAAGVVCVDFQQSVWLIIKIMAAIRNDLIFVLARFERNAVGVFLEEVDSRCGINREHRRPYCRGKPRVHLVEGEKDIDRFCPEFGQDFIQPSQLAAEELTRKHQEFAQEIEPLENPVIVRKKCVLALKADLMQALRRRGMND